MALASADGRKSFKTLESFREREQGRSGWRKSIVTSSIPRSPRLRYSRFEATTRDEERIYIPH
jgi:hypothetical protein